jgi:hypothetical protein
VVGADIFFCLECISRFSSLWTLWTGATVTSSRLLTAQMWTTFHRGGHAASMVPEQSDRIGWKHWRQ